MTCLGSLWQKTKFRLKVVFSFAPVVEIILLLLYSKWNITVFQSLGTHAPSLSRYLTLIQTLSLSHSLTYSPSHSLTHSHAHSLTHTLFLSFSYSFTISLSHSLALSHAGTHIIEKLRGEKQLCRACVCERERGRLWEREREYAFFFILLSQTPFSSLALSPLSRSVTEPLSQIFTELSSLNLTPSLSSLIKTYSLSPSPCYRCS